LLLLLRNKLHLAPIPEKPQVGLYHIPATRRY
jgi:hypothetical protein